MKLAKEFEKLFPTKIYAGNDANVAALGECWKGGGKSYENIALLTLGTGVGGGIISEGKIVTGSVGAAGEVGHFNINQNETESCGCGNNGCLEQYASATSIVNEAKKTLKNIKDPTKLNDLKNITAKDIFDLAKSGDKISMYLVDELADKLGLACSYIACVSNPDTILIGGGVAKAGNILIEKISEKFLKYAFHAHRKTIFKLAELGNDAGIYGAVKLALE